MNSLLLLNLITAALAGTLKLDIHKQKTNASRGNDISHLIHSGKSKGYLPESLVFGSDAYFTDLYIGSNGQKVSPMIDTGSSDLWVMAASNPYCVSAFNCTDQVFDPETSTTFHNLSLPFDIQYMDTTGAFGYLGKDNVVIGGQFVSDVKFAIANSANSSVDVLGVAYIKGEYESMSYIYDNFPAQLKRDGIIDSNAYSLYLNDIQSGEGEILFGGIDKSKYTGELGLVPVLIDPFDPSFTVVLNGINIHTGENSCPLVEAPIPVVLDSGTTYAVLFPEIIVSMGQALGYEYDSNSGYYQGSCTNDFGFDSFELNFSGIKLQVPPSTLLERVYNGQQPVNASDGTPLCALTLEATSDPGSLVLGDIFLRNFYVVYDMDNNQIALAQTKFNEISESDVEPIVSAIPSATSAPSYSSTQTSTSVQTYTNYASCKSN